ncbi:MULTISPECIES: hypothetical protein [unclassified Clostridium]|uniref:hypothetical protein n=1 Tax=unclassified Clostridium TaxID=2614128 RepID=UPI0025BB29AA|nr:MULTISPECIES: hypothetical protein [unclassified Clostridium]
MLKEVYKEILEMSGVSFQKEIEGFLKCGENYIYYGKKYIQDIENNKYLDDCEKDNIYEKVIKFISNEEVKELIKFDDIKDIWIYNSEDPGGCDYEDTLEIEYENGNIFTIVSV